MHPALSLLLKLRGRARLRRLLAGLKSVQGLLLVLVTALFFGCMVVPNLLLPLVWSLSPDGARLKEQMIEAARPMIETIGPLFLLGFALMSIGTSMGEVAIYFAPAEVDFLFAAPFTRRELLLYKLRQSLRNALVAGTLFTLVCSRFAPHILGAWLGCVLAVLFLNALTLAVTLLGQSVTARADTQSRRMVLAAAAILVALGLWQALPAFDGQSLLSVAEEFRSSPPGRVLLAPFEVFPRIVTARSYPAVALWSGIGVAMIAALFALAIGLDVNYLETAQQVSQRVYERLSRRRMGGGAIAATPIRGARIRLPRLPWLAGVGPNLWRQLLLQVRRSQGLLFLIFFVLVGGGAAAMALRQVAPQSEYVLPLMILAGLAYQSLLASLQLPTGFRGDLDRLDWLKSLPLRSAAVVCGQVTGAALLLSGLQAIILLGAWLLVGRGHEVFLAGLVLLLPVNWLLFGIENLVFLMFPYRQTPTTAGDFQFFGKFLLFSLLKMALACLGLAVAAAGAVLYLIVPSLWLPLTGSLLLLLAIDTAILYLATLAYDRFDVSLHTPA
jgi:hypothetical protein